MRFCPTLCDFIDSAPTLCDFIDSAPTFCDFIVCLKRLGIVNGPPHLQRSQYVKYYVECEKAIRKKEGGGIREVGGGGRREGEREEEEGRI